jgi:hypothetical protein
MKLMNTLVKTAAALSLATAAMCGATGTASAAPNSPLIGYGHVTSGPAVWCVQDSINYFINDLYPGEYPLLDEDSAWGPKTDAAVRWFQSTMHLTQVDGIVGKDTGVSLLLRGNPSVTGGIARPTNAPCYPFLPDNY